MNTIMSKVEAITKLFRTLFTLARRDAKSYVVVILTLFSLIFLYTNFVTGDKMNKHYETICNSKIEILEKQIAKLQVENDSLSRNIFFERKRFAEDISKIKQEQAEILERVLKFIADEK